ncbi:MAG: serine/threonine protein kinase [Gemmataceae bacterium]
MADHLIRSGKLTRFQAGKLLRGIYQGMILGHFCLLAPFCKGGMGTVFLARDQRNQLLVALKVLPPSLAKRQTRMVARFLREMELSQKVAHPHLAWTYEVGEFRGVYYIAMEYIPGKTLARVIQEEGPMRCSRAARLMSEVASGLAHAHDQGLIHRDLKPGNIMVTPHDHAKVVDLGLALIDGEIVGDNSVVGGQGYIVGTMDYIAPEQTIDAAGVDRRSDLYSLGCTLYFAISGRPPFPGGTSKEKIQRHRLQLPTPLIELVPTAAPEFVQLVELLMQKDPDRRPNSAREVMDRLLMWASEDALPQFGSSNDLNYKEIDVWKELPNESEFSQVSLPSIPSMGLDKSSHQAFWFKPKVRRKLLLLLLGFLILLFGSLVLVVLWREYLPISR